MALERKYPLQTGFKTATIGSPSATIHGFQSIGFHQSTKYFSILSLTAMASTSVPDFKNESFAFLIYFYHIFHYYVSQIPSQIHLKLAAILGVSSGSNGSVN